MATLSIRLAPHDQDIPFHLASRWAGAVSRLRRCRDGATVTRAARSGGGATSVKQAAAMLARPMVEHGPLVVIIDDLQWIDRPSLAVLELLTREIAGSPVSVVCAVRTPAEQGPILAGRVMLERLDRAGLARLVTLRPLSAGQVDAVVRGLTQARPHHTLSTALRTVSRGVPAALHAAVDGYRRSGSLRVVDHHAYLVGVAHLPDLPLDHQLFAPIRALPAPAWELAKAVAVLHPLGDAVAGLAGAALSLDPPDVLTGLDALVGARVLHRRRRGGWRFVIPLLATALRSQLGPYERRRLAQTAVTAVWDATAAAERGCFADQLAEAGTFVDGARAAAELLAMGTESVLAGKPQAARWLAAAVNLATDPISRKQALLAHANGCWRHGDFLGARRSAQRLIDEHAGELTPDELQEAQLIYVLSLQGTGDRTTVAQVASGARRLAGDAGSGVVARAVALWTSGRLAEARDLLAGARPVWSSGGVSGDSVSGNGVAGDGVAAQYGALVEAGAAALLGRPKQFQRLLAGPAEVTGSYWRREWVATQVRLLALLGDLRRAEELLRERRLPESELSELDQILLAWRRGRWHEALDRAQVAVATRDLAGYEPGRVLMHHAIAVVHFSRGQPVHARAALDTARAGQVALPHLLDLVEATIERTFGSSQAAVRTAAAGLASAQRSGVVAGTEELWLLMAELAVDRQDHGAARRSLAETARVAEAMGTDYSRLHHLLARVVVNADPHVASEAVATARVLGQPFLLARTLELVVRSGGATPDLLREAYALLGQLDAILNRCWVRNLMRAHDIAVPNREATVLENERLLATLVAEGASNRQLATVLQASEKSVEGRLSRLFSRTGYRSRAELATAVLSGDYRPQ